MDLSKCEDLLIKVQFNLKGTVSKLQNKFEKTPNL